MHNPFEEVTPLDPLDDWEVFTSTLQRSMMWDFAGPEKIQENPQSLGQQPASPDVLKAEYKEMMLRHSALAPISRNLSIMCYIAAESATQALLQLDPKYAEMPEAERLQFRVHNVNIGAAITSSVLSHLLQGDFLHYGGHS